jgi:alpha-glucosidase
VMLYALRGTPFIYQGEELCLPDAEIAPDRIVDVDGRDPERAPIPWEPPSVAGPGAGFTTGEPWLPLIAEAEELCVARQAQDPDSALSLYRRLAALRAGSAALQTGSQRTLDLGRGLLSWIREAGEERILAIVNFAGTESAPVALEPDATLLLSSRPGREGSVRTLDPYEAVLLRLES